MNLEKNEFIKINEYCYLAYINTDREEQDWKYVVGVSTMPGYEDDWGMEIFGYGDTSNKAIFMALDYLSKSALKGISFDSLSDISFKDLLLVMNNKEGTLSSPPALIKASTQDGFITALHLFIHKGKAIGGVS